ncbi:MAG: 4Fe-4S binding protein [Anaerolineae bacterium]|nr:4Fe-4S binding protein [Anaerolineae bacterium]
MRPQTWRRLRQLAQVLAFLLFLYLFIYATFLNPQRTWADLFYRLDPLVALTSMLAGRVWIAGLGLAGVTVLVTLVFGRVWCGWFCPLGTVLEWLSPRRTRVSAGGRARYKRPSEKWRVVKYVLLVVLVCAALLGNQTLLFFDPITIMTRTTGMAIWPALKVAIYKSEAFLYRFRFLWGILDFFHNTLIFPIFKDITSVFTQTVPIFLFFVAIVALNWWAERFWCRYLCPLGGLLGVLSKFSLLRRDVGDMCASCALCGGDCPTGAIDPKNEFRSDPAECIICYDCIVDCTREGVAFHWFLPFLKLPSATRDSQFAIRNSIRPWHPAEWYDYNPQRRQVLAGAVMATAGVALAGVEPVTQREPTYMVRPPGATSTDFETLCVRCGECMRVCPTQGLQPSLFEGGIQNVLTPRLVPRLGYCDYTCNACGEVCPTGAIPQLPLEEKRHTPIGLARVDRSRCLPWAYNIPCIVCEEACPVQHKAIWLYQVEATNTQSESIVIQLPYVVKELCIGCGICEYQCPMGGESAIRVFAPTDVGGYVGNDPEFRPHRQWREE